MKQVITDMVTVITYVHYMEAFQPGSFQNNMDGMQRINGLPKVMFPTNIVAEDLKDLFKDALNNNQQPTSCLQTDQETNIVEDCWYH